MQDNWAAWLYVAILLWLVCCLGYGHHTGKVNLWELVTATDRHGVDRTDSRKLFETGAFLIMTTAFAYWALIDKLTEAFAAIYVGAFVTARYLRDREQRMNRVIDISKAAEDKKS